MNAAFPDKLRFLFEPHPYKIAYGGRDGCKSWGFARALLITAAGQRRRVVCARETMRSIADSVHTLLSDQVRILGLDSFYTVQQNKILGRNGSQFTFVGLRHDPDSIKSLEGADVLWVEEAQSVSRESWEVAIPTVRKEGSEIWVSFNPMMATDDTYKRWVLAPPPGAFVQKISWEDNKWLSETSRARIEHMRATDPLTFVHIYGGECRSAVEGAIYSNEMKLAMAEGRIGNYPYNRAKPVDTAWDLGFGDLTAIWFVQAYDGYFNFIDYEEGLGLTISDYLVKLQERRYVYGTDWLPHDGIDTIIHRRLAGGGDRSTSIEQIMRNAGRKVRLTPKMLITDGINAARTVFPQCRFDQDRCAQGLEALRCYQWGEPSAQGVVRREPLHNWASHAADGFRGAAVAIKQPKREMPKVEEPEHSYQGSAWS